MREFVLATIRRYAMVEPGQRLGVAVSGGPDSVCLLDVLVELRQTLRIDLAVVHLDHQLRGAESARDAEFVLELAHQLGLDCYLEKAQLERTERDENLEQACRKARRAFFTRLIRSGVVQRIATGHTRSDQAETVLMRLLRGAGTTGLAGILPVTAEGLIRPLLGVSRKQVLDYLQERNLSFRTDQTNQDRSLFRNRLRWEVIPILREQGNPAFEQQLAQLAELAQAEEAYWRQETARRAKEGLTTRPGSVFMRCSWLGEQPLALARRIIRHALEQVKGDLRRIECHHVEQVLELIRDHEGHGRCQLPELDVCRSFDWLRIARKEQPAEWPRGAACLLNVPGQTSLGPVQIETRLLPGVPGECGYNEGKGEASSFCFLNWDLLEKPLTLRFWLPGDEYRPGGAPGPQKLKQLFQTHRVPLWERRYWPVIEQGGNGQIVWSRRFGPAEGFQACQSASLVLRVEEHGDGAGGFQDQ
ncbi:MAG: tRNA lysidine(34) synthetase TilS [Bryobacteraceae bacterium]|nr:tRNA lysidine(34) synthetase TilS [Bryobacteraceae bacterium]MDW8377495.1 tRNA lysidine(34) synthetase TilS [Bryobacterales bacterium]